MKCQRRPWPLCSSQISWGWTRQTSWRRSPSGPLSTLWVGGGEGEQHSITLAEWYIYTAKYCTHVKLLHTHTHTHTCTHTHTYIHHTHMHTHTTHTHTHTHAHTHTPQVVTGATLGEVAREVICNVRFPLLDPAKLSQVEKENQKKEYIPVRYSACPIPRPPVFGILFHYCMSIMVSAFAWFWELHLL